MYLYGENIMSIMLSLMAKTITNVKKLEAILMMNY